MALSQIPSSDLLGEAVYNRIRDAIITGELAPGERLRVPSLAKELGVSRSPVREAVIRLINERLAVSEPRLGAVVTKVDRHDLVVLYEVREVLEGLAARLAAKSPSRELITNLSMVLDEHEQAVSALDLAKHVESDTSFHRFIRLSTGNPELVRLLDHIEAQVRLAMLTVTATAGPKIALEEHKAIFSAVRDSDMENAERLARMHIIRLRDALEDEILDAV